MIVTVVAYKRPELLKMCLESIMAADLSPVTLIVVSCDWHSEEMNARMIDTAWDIFPHDAPAMVMVKHNNRLGVANHPRALFDSKEVFHAGLLICALEEDTIVSPDAFTFADWALRQPEYKFVNLYSHISSVVARELGKKYVEQMVDENVHEDNELRGGFGWAFSRAFWAELEPQWNGKIRAPYGWDWQLTHLCHRNNWRVLTPEVSRVYNTGRENGTYDTPSNWDVTQKDVVICQADPCGSKYVIVKHNLDGAPVPEWVREEMRA